MKPRRFLTGAAVLLLLAQPSFAVIHEQDLGATLNSLKNELKYDYERRVASENNFEDLYRAQRMEMVNIMKKCNELSLMLYSQKQDFTFDITYVFKSVSDEYNDFRGKQLPYDRITGRLDWDIDRYARLLESLRRLPPRLESIEAIPDSLAYHNDSLDFRPRRFNRGRPPGGLAASMGLQQARDTTRRPYILNEAEQLDRDSCIYYASEMLKMCASRRETVIADSTHYHRTYLRLKESYDYAQDRYVVLQERVFKQGQTPYYIILPHFSRQWNKAVQDCNEKTSEGWSFQEISMDSSSLKNLIWLVIAILAALLLRLKGKDLVHGLLLYLPLVLSAIGIFALRIAFLPNSMMNILLPPLLLVFLVYMFVACLRHGPKVPGIDRILGWSSVGMLAVSLVVSFIGYIFVGLLIMVWWYFQITAALAIVTVAYLLELFRTKVLDRHIAEYKKTLTYLPAEERGKMLFGVTWLYDLVKEVLLPVAIVVSVPVCVKMALQIFNFTNLYDTIIYKPFINLTGSTGTTMLRLSLSSIISAVAMFFVFRYVEKALFFLYKSVRYSAYLRKNGRKTVRVNEINFSLPRSIISAIVWVIYVIAIVVMLKLPTSSLTVIAGGLSAGIGIAMKDIINNFVYGIQLMSGRVRVGDWIECDGVRGRVTSISYQSTQIETIEGAVMSFLNSTLFAKNFRNLTRNHSYELLKLVVGVSYGTDVAKVRDVLTEAMQQLRTKDAYGREIVDPKKGIYVTFEAFDDSSVNIAVKQFVLVAERIGYTDRAREVIYNALAEAGITIPFPQRDIHIINE